jgi:DEAD/DEAH box helicase domain-containing protein
LHPDAWWLAGNPIAAQFERFIAYLLTMKGTCWKEVEQLLRRTDLSDRAESLVKQSSVDFHDACSNWSADYEELVSAWQKALSKEHRPTLNGIAYQAAGLWSTPVIEALAVRRFLPRYGFPIDVQSLTEQTMSDKKPVRLQRGAVLALSEYVPGSTILAGGRSFTSRGVLNFWSAGGEKSFGERRWQYTCCDGHRWTTLQPYTAQTCHYEGCTEYLVDSGRELLFPRFGYATAVSDPPTWSGSQERIGQTAVATAEFLTASSGRTALDFGRMAGLSATFYESSDLLASNAGSHSQGFALCLKCGYADSERTAGADTASLPSGFIYHVPLRDKDRRCWRTSESPVLRHQHLSAMHNTDLLEIDLASVPHLGSLPMVTTFGHALHLAAAELLEIDPRELGLAVATVGSSRKVGVQLFDSAAGGSGHMLELFSRGPEWLNAVETLLFRDSVHDAICSDACVRCLLTAGSQAAYENGLLDRRSLHAHIATTKTLIESNHKQAV